MIHRNIALRRHRRTATGKSVRLADVAAFIDGNRQTAVRYRRRMQGDTIAHNDRTGTRVKHHAGAGLFRLHGRHLTET